MATQVWTTSGSDMITVTSAAVNIIPAQPDRIFYHVMISNGDDGSDLLYSLDGGAHWGRIEAGNSKTFDGVRIKGTDIKVKAIGSEVVSDVYAEAW